MDPLFEVHLLNSSGIRRASLIANAFNGLLSDLTELIGNGREAAIVKTKLEEACFFAKKGMANQKEKQQAP